MSFTGFTESHLLHVIWKAFIKTGTNNWNILSHKSKRYMVFMVMDYGQ